MSICVHGYVCAEACAHICICMWRSEVNFKCHFSSGAIHLIFIFWERMLNNYGTQIHRGFREGREGTKESCQATMRDLVILIQEMKSFHSWNMKIFFSLIAYFLISFLYYFENHLGLSIRALLRVKVQNHYISSCSCFTFT